MLTWKDSYYYAQLLQHVVVLDKPASYLDRKDTSMDSSIRLTTVHSIYVQIATVACGWLYCRIYQQLARIEERK
jgi:hypothetical protein